MRPEPLILAVDGNSLVHRAFHSQAATGMRDTSGRPAWAVRGLLVQLVAAVERLDPDVVVVGFDDPSDSLRRTRWPDYKAGRADKLPTLVAQLEQAVAVLTALGVSVVVPPGLEADDVLASVAAAAPRVGARTVIMTSDRDAFALIDPHTRVLRILNGGVEASPLLDDARLRTMIGIGAAQYRDFAALRGDPSDNLPGVRGIGPKTAAKLLAGLGCCADAFADLAAGGTRVASAAGRRAAELLSDADARRVWELNCQVMAMHTDVELGDLLAGPGLLPLSEHAVRRVFTEHQLVHSTRGALRVLARVEADDEPVTPPVLTWLTAPRSGSGVRRMPPLPAKPVTAQLSLFD